MPPPRVKGIEWPSAEYLLSNSHLIMWADSHILVREPAFLPRDLTGLFLFVRNVFHMVMLIALEARISH